MQRCDSLPDRFGAAAAAIADAAGRGNVRLGAGSGDTRAMDVGAAGVLIVGLDEMSPEAHDAVFATRMTMEPSPTSEATTLSGATISHEGEEAGLLGSRWFVDHPTLPLESIVAAHNIDMVGKGRTDQVKLGGPTSVQTLGARRFSREFGDIIDKDIPVTYFSLGYAEDYHQPTDEPQYVEYDHAARVGRFVRDADRQHLLRARSQKGDADLRQELA